MQKPINFGVSGLAGSFSDAAAQRYAEQAGISAQYLYLIDMEGVLNAVEKGLVDLGIFPVVNLRGGLVNMAFTAMGKHLFTPIEELWLEVHQCLLVAPTSTAAAIKKIVSHPQSLRQCREYLQREFPKAVLIEWSDTALAAKDLAEGKLSEDCAVIAPKRAAQLYQLKVLTENIEDQQPNLTAFIIAKSFNAE